MFGLKKTKQEQKNNTLICKNGFLTHPGALIHQLQVQHPKKKSVHKWIKLQLPKKKKKRNVFLNSQRPSFMKHIKQIE